MTEQKTVQFAANTLRAILMEEGADDAGFVEIGRKALAPEVEDIKRVFPQTRTIVSIAKKVNQASVQSQAVNVADEEFRRTCDDLSGVCRKTLRRLNGLGVRGVCLSYAFPADMNRWPGKIWDISHKTVAVEAGVGQMGLNRLVIHPRYGNFLVITTLLLDAELDSYSQPLKDNPCIKCRLCAAVCPVNAISQDGQFEFMACFTHSYRETLSGFQDWVERMVSATDVRTYRAWFRDSETVSMWQSLTFGYSYKCSYCMAVCPAGSDVIVDYLPDKKAYFEITVNPLIQKKEPVYLLAGTRAEVAVKKNPSKEARYVRTPIRPTSIAGFLMGVTLAFNPEKAQGVNMNIQFNFTGKEDVSATVVIGMGKINVSQGAEGKADLVVYADSEVWIKFLNKEVSLLKAIFSRKLRVRGNPLFMKKFQDCLLLF
ncbi:MAG: SCP2 sterol-binding domain-containing protein [Nitrospirota bacterium]